MKGFPKTISTGQDLMNCLSLVKAGDVSKDDMLTAIEHIENRGFLSCPIIAISDTRKGITIRYCCEVAAGQIVNGIEVSSVEHLTNEDNEPESTVVTLKKALPATTEILLVPSPVKPLERLGLTVAQFNDIKEALV